MQTLASVQKGHEFSTAEFELSRDWVTAYVTAVEDGAIASLGADAVPPMAVAALAIRALLEGAGLPAGAIHVGQELAFRRAARAGDRLAVKASVANRGERAGWVLMGVDISVESGAGEVMSGRSVVTFPAGEAS
jgi:acyl dehydratase